VNASTHVAATADGGLLDAALVGVAGATTIDISTVGTDVAIRVNDGSGLLKVVFDARIGPNGILVPVTGSTWQLKVRADTDVTIN
jgi:hypothetical protein